MSDSAQNTGEAPLSSASINAQKQENPQLIENIQRAYKVLKNAVADHPSWERLHTYKGVEVKRSYAPKSTPGSDCPMYQAIGTVHVTPKELLHQAILDVDKITKWSSVETIEVLDPYRDCCQLNNNCPYEIYRQTHAPVLGGLISPRDFINFRSWDLSDPDGSLWFVCASIQDERWPPHSKFVRGNVYITAVHATPLENNRQHCRVHYLVQVSIGGYLPQWTINRGIVTEISDTYGRLNELLFDSANQEQQEQGSNEGSDNNNASSNSTTNNND